VHFDLVISDDCCDVDDDADEGYAHCESPTGKPRRVVWTERVLNNAHDVVVIDFFQPLEDKLYQ